MLAAFRLWLALVESSRDLGDIEVGRVLALEQPEPGATRGYLLHCLDKTMRSNRDASAICLVGQVWVNRVKRTAARIRVNEPRTIEQNVAHTVD